MATFPTKNKAPGVYIQEITLPGPLAPVSTSNAAFVGPAAMGPLLTPKELTSLDQFQAVFGDYLEDPYRVLVTHAVNGFFAEGGALCYFVRVGTGKQATLNLLDRSGKSRTTMVVTALTEGLAGNGIQVQVQDASLASTKATRASATVRTGGASAAQAKVVTTNAGDGPKLKVGDIVVLSKGTDHENATISAIATDAGTNTTTLTMAANITKDYSGGSAQVPTLTIDAAGAAKDQNTVTTTSAGDAAKLAVGNTVTLVKGTDNEPAIITAIVSNAGPNTTTITMKSNLSKDYSGGKVQPPNMVVVGAGALPGQRSVTTSNPADAAKFRPGDTVLLASGAKNERATISSIAKDANTTTFTLVASLGNDYSGGTIRIANLIPGQAKLRLDSVAKLEPGTYVSVHAGGTPETGVVRLVDSTNNFIWLDDPLTQNFGMDASVPDPDVVVDTQEFKLTIKPGGIPDEVFDDLSLDPRHHNYFANVVTSAVVSVTLADPPTTTEPTGNLPVAVGPVNLIGGVDEDLTALQPSHYHAGIDTLKKIDDVNLLCVPDAVSDHFSAVADSQDIQTYMVQHCQNKQDRFAILDSRKYDPKDITFDAIKTQRANLNSDNGYAALYFPWISISNPFGSGQILVPPSGHTAGVYANNDNNFGVFKAPANEAVTSALALEVVLTDEEQGPLNELGINVIRKFSSEGIKIWGARTISPVTPWRFINVRRLVTFIEITIQKGTRFAVFEPNNLTLWKQVKRLVTNFLTGLWTDGALRGDTPDLAFRVRVDETLNTPDTLALGQLIVEVTVVPTTPAEFIIFQVVQDITGGSLNESTT
jgi:uncharacterized protein